MGGVRRPSRRAGRDWESPQEGQEVRDVLQGGQEGKGGPLGGLGGVRSYSQWDGMGREALPNGQEGLGVVESPIRRAMRGQEGSGGPPNGP